MSEREMLERAAAAAGYVIEYWAQDDYPVVRDGDRQYGWNPRVFDSDALRLAVRCAQLFGFYRFMRAWMIAMATVDGSPGDPYAATRLAITRAAAALAPTAQGE